MKILAISDVPSKLLWDESVRKRLEGIDLILTKFDLDDSAQATEFAEAITRARIVDKLEKVAENLRDCSKYVKENPWSLTRIDPQEERGITR